MSDINVLKRKKIDKKLSKKIRDLSIQVDESNNTETDDLSTRETVKTTSETKENDYSNRIIELETDQSDSFKTLINALKEAFMDVCIEFDETGMCIQTLDPSHTLFVYVKIYAEKVTHYYCKHKIKIGLNLVNLFKLINLTSQNDILTLYIDNNVSPPEVLNIEIINDSICKKATYTLRLLDVDEHELTFPKLEYPSHITMLSKLFNDICKGMLISSDQIEIISVGSEIIFKGAGTYTSQEYKLGPSNNLNFERYNNTEVIQGYFNLTHLVQFSKCANFSTSIDLHIANELPLVIIYNIGNIGQLKLVLVSKTNDT